MISVFKFKIYQKLSLICNCDMNLSGFGFHILGFFITICRFSLGGAFSFLTPGAVMVAEVAEVAEVARWETLVCPGVGVFCLIYAVTLSR